MDIFLSEETKKALEPNVKTERSVELGIALFCLIGLLLGLLAFFLASVVDQISNYSFDRWFTGTNATNLVTEEILLVGPWNNFQSYHSVSRNQTQAQQAPPSYRSLFLNAINMSPPSYQQAIRIEATEGTTPPDSAV